jgi:hypothetical protein
VLMDASICCAEAEAYTQFTIFDLPKLKKQCLIFRRFYAILYAMSIT